jgi:hypothetical protein
MVGPVEPPMSLGDDRLPARPGRIGADGTMVESMR